MIGIPKSLYNPASKMNSYDVKVKLICLCFNFQHGVCFHKHASLTTKTMVYENQIYLLETVFMIYKSVNLYLHAGFPLYGTIVNKIYLTYYIFK
jgi:hypothetical protein